MKHQNPIHKFPWSKSQNTVGHFCYQKLNWNLTLVQESAKSRKFTHESTSAPF